MNLADQFLSDGYEVAALAAIEGARPDPVLHVDRWSEDNQILPKSSSTPGEYRIRRSPPARRVLQCLSPGHPARRVVVRGASQMLKTQCALNWIGASIDQAPANILALEPSDKLAKRLSARIQRMAMDVKVLREKVAAQRSRDARNTVDTKEFPGGTLYITTAGAAANLAEIPARYVFLDEVDRMPRNVQGEGKTWVVAEARTSTFPTNAKIYAVSSPTETGESTIDELYEMGTQEVYLVPCPHCGHMHELLDENFHFSRDHRGIVNRAWFTCPDCGADIDEHHKGEMLRDIEDGGQAHWFARSEGDGETVSFHISAFYAGPGFITWLQLARQKAMAEEAAKLGDKDGLRVYYNTRLALSYSDDRAVTTSDQLMKRAEPYQPRVLPDPALVLTMSVDTQVNRLEVQIEAWGPQGEHWLMDYLVLMGSPTEPPDKPGSVWQRLDEIRTTPLMHVSGVPIYISAYGIDTGGANTQDVYHYGSSRVNHGCLLLKGANRPNRPIIAATPTKQDIDWGGKRMEGGALLWQVGTDVAKDWIFNRLQLTSGPGAFHFHSQLEKAWFDGILAETLRTTTKRGRRKREYVAVSGVRNEPLDLTVYNLAVAQHLGILRWSAQDWQRLRERLIPRSYTPDLFAAAQPTPPRPEQTLPAAQQQPAEAQQQATPALQTPEQALQQPAVVQPDLAPTPEPVMPAVVPPAAPPHVPPVAGRRMLSRGIR